jgi:hypothetical protein
MLSILEAIELHIRKPLLASGFLSQVERELQGTNLFLTLKPIQGFTISERIICFCINFFGEHKPSAHSYELFGSCAAFVECPNDQTCKVWVDCDFYCGYAGFDVLSELLVLGLKLSNAFIKPSSSSHSVYCLKDLVQVYRTKEEVLDFYEQFAARIIQAGDDLFTETCDPSRRARWTCCPKHQYIFLQRLMIADWLPHIFDVWDPSEEYEALPDMDYLVDHPSVEHMQQRISHLLAQTFSPQEWLRARFAYAAQAEREHWERPVRHICQCKHHISLACCQFHTAMTAIWYLFSAWLEHYNDLYQISSMVNEKGYTTRLFSVNGIALLIHLARLDTDGISFTSWFESIHEVDVNKFHRQDHQ